MGTRRSNGELCARENSSTQLGVYICLPDLLYPAGGILSMKIYSLLARGMWALASILFLAAASGQDTSRFRSSFVTARADLSAARVHTECVGAVLGKPFFDDALLTPIRSALEFQGDSSGREQK
jgi:hypothetical protein